MYTEVQKEQALSLYHQNNSVAEIIEHLGYPTRQTLYKWIEESSLPPKEKAPRKKWTNTPEHPRVPSASLKLNTIHRCFDLGENIQLVSEEIGYSRTSIYTWRKQYLRDGEQAFSKSSRDSSSYLHKTSSHNSQETERLKAQIQTMQAEIDVLKRRLELAEKRDSFHH